MSVKMSLHGDIFHRGAIYSLIATCLVLPVATSLLSIFSLLTILLWILSGRAIELPGIVKNNPIVSLATGLLILFIIGLSYSSAEFSESIGYLKKYRELLFFPVIITLLKNDKLAQSRCESAFLLGCIVLLTNSYCMFLGIIPSARYGNSILYHITHNFFISILTFYAAHKIFEAPRPRGKVLWASLFILSVVNMFYIAPGRTGMLVFLFLMILFFMQRLSLIKQLVCLTILTAMLTIAFQTSDNFSSRSKVAVQEVQNYEYGASRTSLGMRFDWWINSLALMKEKPLLGHGTGSFITEHDRYIKGTKMMKTDNPHNEFLLVGVQLGGIGLVLISALFVTQLVLSFRLSKPARLYSQGVLMAMLIGCTLNSFLFDTHQGHFWAILSAIYFSSLSKSINNDISSENDHSA